ncbi:hypothetical protein CDD83_5754 [Cordyceps sp. RAO-2017]|nr:hypothetical protein CDD83_5754 [Cordyceps sp. RAO-2017]
MHVQYRLLPPCSTSCAGTGYLASTGAGTCGLPAKSHAFSAAPLRRPLGSIQCHCRDQDQPPLPPPPLPPPPPPPPPPPLASQPGSSTLSATLLAFDSAAPAPAGGHQGNALGRGPVFETLLLHRPSSPASFSLPGPPSRRLPSWLLLSWPLSSLLLSSWLLSSWLLFSWLLSS